MSNNNENRIVIQIVLTREVYTMNINNNINNINNNIYAI